MARAARRAIRIYRRDSSHTQLANGAAATAPTIVPIHGFDAITVFARSPTGGGAFTITISQFMRGNSTAVVVATLTCAAESFLNQSIEVTGELASIGLTNGVTAQRPEVLIKLV